MPHTDLSHCCKKCISHNDCCYCCCCRNHSTVAFHSHPLCALYVRALCVYVCSYYIPTGFLHLFLMFAPALVMGGTPQRIMALAALITGPVAASQLIDGDRPRLYEWASSWCVGGGQELGGGGAGRGTRGERKSCVCCALCN